MTFIISNPRTIVWDMDEVLANLREFVCRTIAPALGRPTDWLDWEDYAGLYRYMTDTPERFIDALIEHQAIERCDVERGAKDALALFARAGYRNVIVTARGWHPRAIEETWAWLGRNEMASLIADIAAVPVYGSKVEAIRRFGPAELYVEDSGQHIAAALADGQVRRAVLIDRPWNRKWFDALDRSLMHHVLRMDDIARFDGAWLARELGDASASQIAATVGLER